MREVTQEQKKEYGKYVERMTPTHNTVRQMARAFVTGGAICTVGQVILHVSMERFGLERQDAASWCSLIMIAVSVLLTGLNLYPMLVKWGGAGALVPITGFANSVAAPAIEYKTEGQVFGVGCMIFTIAGPVILFGIFASFLVGLLQFLL